MCGSTKLDRNWQWEYPNKQGDYLWVALWSCGCIRRYGIVWAFEGGESDEPEGELIKYPGGQWGWIYLYFNEAKCGTANDPNIMSDGSLDINAFFPLKTPVPERDERFEILVPMPAGFRKSE